MTTYHFQFAYRRPFQLEGGGVSWETVFMTYADMKTIPVVEEINGIVFIEIETERYVLRHEDFIGIYGEEEQY